MLNAYQSTNTPFTSLAEFAYDSVLTLAAMLDRTLAILESGNMEETGCQDLNRTLNISSLMAGIGSNCDLMGCLFLNVLRNLSVEGLTVQKVC